MAKRLTKRDRIEVSNPTGILVGYAILFKNYSTEFWRYDPRILTKQQRNRLGIIGWHGIAEIVVQGSEGSRK